MTSKPVSPYPMRPVYRWETDGPPEEFIARLNQLVSFDPAVRMQCGTTHCTLSIPEEASHRWSPTLDVQVRAHGDRCRVNARMGPAPEVWTMFMFLYAASGLPALLGSLFGMVQWTLGDTPWGLLALPVAALFWTGLYVASLVGRGLGADQIHQLLAVMDANLSVSARDITDEA